jgi:hypothetical protein
MYKIIRCQTCNADPAGRWKQPPAMIFIDSNSGAYGCRDHLSPAKENEIQAREAKLGLRKGELR